MTGDPIPDNDHVAYYCSPAKLDDGLPSSYAFLPRCRFGEYEGYVSVNHLEHFGDADTTCALQCVRDALRKKIELKSTGGIAILNAGAVRQAGQKAGNNAICVEEQPEDGDSSHAGIVGYECAGRRTRTQLDLRVALALKSLVMTCHMRDAVLG